MVCGVHATHKQRAKRARLLEPAQPGGTVASSVLHVRGLPDNSTEPELLALAQRFGPVSEVMLMIGKGQGFAQYATREAATLALQRAAATPGEIRCVHGTVMNIVLVCG